MSPSEIREFERHEFYKEAIMLRSWDDKAKIPGLPTPSLAEYRNLVNAIAVSA
jgi:predicted HD phosphohydrolase